MASLDQRAAVELVADDDRRHQRTGTFESRASNRCASSAATSSRSVLFAIEIDTCARCQGRLRVIASIEEPELIARILAH